MNPYEVMYIIDSGVDEETVDQLVERFRNLVAQTGGQVIGVDKWGKRRFAYEIKGRTEGYYVVMTFKASAESVAELSRVLRITDNVVRHLVVRLREEPKPATEQPAAAPEAESAGAEPAAQTDAQASDGAASDQEAEPAASDVEATESVETAT